MEKLRFAEKPFLPHIELPDLSPIDCEKDGFERVVTREVNVVLDGKKLKAVITFERSSQARDPVRIAIECYDPALDEFEGRMSSFKAVLLEGKNAAYEQYTTDGKDHPHWQIHTRRVDKSLRRKGFGEWNMRLMEQLIRQVSNRHPELHADWIQLETFLGALSNLVIDPDWLEQNLGPHDKALLQRAQNKQLNLGYFPHPKDVLAAKRLLAEKTDDMDDIRGGEKQPVTFIKLINPKFDPRLLYVKTNPFAF